MTKRYIAKIIDVDTQKVVSSGIFRTPHAANVFADAMAAIYKQYTPRRIRQTVEPIGLMGLIKEYMATLAR